MDALTLLLNRTSQPRLGAPAPEGEALENIKRAALRSPDHASLTPWRFIVCEKDGLTKLGAIFEKSAIESDKSSKEIERAPLLPLRAPMVIIAIAKVTEHEKVPEIEQIASASCAVLAMQLAAIAQGFQGIWRTGSYAQCDIVKREMQLADNEVIVGFLYLGSTSIAVPERKHRETEQFFDHWS